MTKRKSQLADKLGSSTEARPGWRDTILSTPVQPEPAAPAEPALKPRRQKARRKTYLLAPSLIERIDTLAAEEQVGISDLVSFLLRTAVELVESGEIDIPTSPGRRRIMR